MVFSSIIFLVYFLPLFLIIYYLSDRRYQNYVLLAASILFYSWGAPKFIFVILGTTLLDFFLVKWMDESKNDRKRKLLLILSLSMNLGLLFYFKYCNFFIDNINKLFSPSGEKPIHLLNVILPIGISFYTFESLTYVVDVYRRVHKPLKDFWHYQLYIILFPKLIAGPIIRYHEIADQIPNRSSFDTVDNRLNGFYRFALGLAKKIFIANVMAVKADEAFNMPAGQLTSTVAWIGSLAYTFQIYFDFSGYSDMAIGLGKMIGFRFPENFNNPYTSQSITEFWRRWHITLGKWMKNYLYIPLGGNRVQNKSRLYFNLWLVFLASGFWHGAAWTFIIWGIYHGTFLILERLFLANVYQRIGKFFSVLITFLLVNIGWIFFRADTTMQALHMIQKLFSFQFSAPSIYFNKEFSFYFLLAAFFSFFTYAKAGERIQAKVYFTNHPVKISAVFCIVAGCLYTFAIAALASSGFNPFIYFRF